MASDVRSFIHRYLHLSQRVYSSGAWLLLIAFASQTLLAGDSKDSDLEASIDALQSKYLHVRDLKMEFIQSYRSSRRPMKTETGILFLKRPGMMRWEYETPKKKLFISNGKNVYFYLPYERQVQKTKVKESRDQRVPFLFLLGKGNLKKDFSRVEWAEDSQPFYQGNRIICAYPKKNIDEFAKILMEFNPQTYQLQRVTVHDVDGSTSEFVFTNIHENVGINSEQFDFKIPAGTEVQDYPGDDRASE